MAFGRRSSGDAKLSVLPQIHNGNTCIATLKVQGINVYPILEFELQGWKEKVQNYSSSIEKLICNRDDKGVIDSSLSHIVIYFNLFARHRVIGLRFNYFEISVASKFFSIWRVRGIKRNEKIMVVAISK